MSKNKQPQVPKKNKTSLIRSSAAEYLTFIAAGGQSPSETRMDMHYEDENIGLTQTMMATVSDASVPANSRHLKRINEMHSKLTMSWEVLK